MKSVLDYENLLVNAKVVCRPSKNKSPYLLILI